MKSFVMQELTAALLLRRSDSASLSESTNSAVEALKSPSVSLFCAAQFPKLLLLPFLKLTFYLYQAQLICFQVWAAQTAVYA